MKCAVHAEADAGWELDGRAACDACAHDAEAKSKDLGVGILACVGAGYLGALAVGFLIFHARPLIGGIAAIVAIALGRALTVLVKRPVLQRRPLS